MTDRGATALERLTFFSDAVFAIAITLLVIEVRAPEALHRFSNGALWTELSHVTPGLLAFALSFAVIALFWANHHRAMLLLVRADVQLVWRNFALLFAIALLPFPTALIARYAPLAAGQQVYLAVLLLAAGAQWRLLRLAFVPGRFLASDVDPRLPAIILRRAAALTLVIAVAIALSFATPWAGVGTLALIPVVLNLVGPLRALERGGGGA